ncbi:MAG: hypothetical protein JW760_09310 [Spirochaetales bacterium]|nr:hypothetical protein [Spirochaetales bacterium]
MKRIVPLLFLLVAAASLPAEKTAWAFRTGINLTPGLVYNRVWDPGYNGSALTVMSLRQNGGFILGGGIEAGYNYTGFNLHFPLRAGLTVAGGDSLTLSANLDLMPGLILGIPASYFLFALEASMEAVWQVSPCLGISLSAGPRYTVSPGYGEAVSPLEFIDLTVGLAAVMGN